MEQKKSGRCWMFAGFNILRPKMCKKYNVENFEFSTNYLFFWDKFEKCNTFLQIMIELKEKPLDSRKVDYYLTHGLSDGGQWNYFVNLVLKYGLIPLYCFQESVHSSSTSELNEILHYKLLQYTKQIRSTKHPETLILKFMTEIYRILCIFLGVPPKTITFEYEDKKKKYHKIKNISPLTFYKKYVPVDLNDYVILLNDPRKKNLYYKLYQQKYGTNIWSEPEFQYINVPMTRINELILTSLKHNESVWFGADAHKFLNKSLCSLDEQNTGHFRLLNLSNNLTKEERIEYGYSKISHAMVITGANVENDNVANWQVENSWKKKGPLHGYYNMTSKWMDEFGFEIVVLKQFLTEREKKLYNTKPIVIDEPWNPLGLCFSKN